jgi:hypothetical protein
MDTVPDPATNTVDQVINTVATSTAATVMAVSMCIVTGNMAQARKFPAICPT